MNTQQIDQAIALLQSALHVPAPVSPIAPGHNPDNLSVEQVGEGWRLLDGDEIKNRWLECERWQLDTSDMENRHWGSGNFWTNRTATYRTRLSRSELAALDKPAWTLPAPPAGQRWHRDDFTEQDLPEGWRPFLKFEETHPGCECFDDNKWRAFTSTMGCKLESSWQMKFRTRRPLPSPEPADWDCAEDVPGPVCWMRQNGGADALVVRVSATGVTFWSTMKNGLRERAWCELAELNCEYSTDRKTWHRCVKGGK